MKNLIEKLERRLEKIELDIQDKKKEKVMLIECLVSLKYGDIDKIHWRDEEPSRIYKLY